MSEQVEPQIAENDALDREPEVRTSVDLSSEEWGLVRALRDHSRAVPTAGIPARDSREDFEAMFGRLEQDLFENVAATLDRMLVRADQTSQQLDRLLGRLSETSPLWRAAS